MIVERKATAPSIVFRWYPSAAPIPVSRIYQIVDGDEICFLANVPDDKVETIVNALNDARPERTEDVIKVELSLAEAHGLLTAGDRCLLRNLNEELRRLL